MSPTNPDASIVCGRWPESGSASPSGAFNGFFIAFLRLQPIVVTLSTMFIVQGITLLVMDKPGGFVSPALGDLLIGDAIPSILPKPILLIGVLLALWVWLKRTRFGDSDLCDRQRSRRGPRGRRFDSLRRIRRLCDRRRLLRPCGRVHQRADGLGRSARRQPDAAADIRSRRRRRDDPGRGTRGTAGHDFRRLHPDDGGQHPAGAERFSLLFDRRRGDYPGPRGARPARFSRNSPLVQYSAARFRDCARVGRALPRQIGAATGDRGSSRWRRDPPVAGAALALLKRHAETLRFAAPAYVCFLAVVLVTQLDARPRDRQLELLRFADRAVLVPRHAGAGPGYGDPYRRPRPFAALDHRSLRHPAGGHGARDRTRRCSMRCRWCCAIGASSASSTASASSCSAYRRS